MSKLRLLRDLVRKESVKFLALQETLISGDAISIFKAIWNQGKYEFCQVAAEGQAGAILSVWKKDSFQVVTAFDGRGFLCVVCGKADLSQSQF